MRLDHLIAQRDCVQCPSIPPVCNCGSSQVCVQIAQSCNQCSTFICVDQQRPTSGHGISAGVVAGAVVGILIFLAFVVCVFLWWRRRNAVTVKPAVPEVKDIPAPADTVLNRPDPTEKIVVSPTSPASPSLVQSNVRVYGSSNSTINLDPIPQAPEAQHGLNPFGDGHSIQTTSTGSQSTNVIPIAFVPPPASVLPMRALPTSQERCLSHTPRIPGVELNMDHMNLSVDSVHLSSSVPSSVSAMADDRSYITNASYASDVLSEVPTIVTGRQVASAARAAVVSASATRGHASLPSVRSPLTSSFGPQDTLQEADESHPLPVPLDPFADQRSPAFRSSMAKQDSLHPPQDSDAIVDRHLRNAGSDINDPDRPLSTITQAASVIGANIMDATRVHLGFAQPANASLFPATSASTGSHTLVRVASGRLVSPSASRAGSRRERQQETAMMTVQAQLQQPEKAQVHPQRISMSTMASAVSGPADSILESFTFVPPSPISNRPLRTPPRSPLTQETHHVPNRTTSAQDDALDPPKRRVLGMSAGSQLSSMSTGLGSFPFQIDHGSEGNQGEELPLPNRQNVDKAKQRASLDTLALTKDLTSYPLGFDRR